MRIVIIGAGGHGRIVADALVQSQRHDRFVRPVGFLDDDPSQHGRNHLELPVIGGLDKLARVPHDAVVVAIGDNETRRRVALALEAKGETLASVRHPTSVIAPDAVIGAGSMISAGVVVTTGVRVGRGCILNTRCVVDHDCSIGDWAHLGPGSVLGGDVVVGALALVGLGACVIPGRRVGDEALVGAGAVVTDDVPAAVTSVGVPARVTRRRR